MQKLPRFLTLFRDLCITDHDNDSGTSLRQLAMETASLLLVVAVAILLRAPGIGHLLMWDEAMDVCATRSFVARGSDFYSPMFWVHPPVFPLMMAWMNPLAPGFAERSEWLAVGLNAMSLVVLYLLNRRLFGPFVAWISCACLAVMPGAIFFQTWIKRDHAVVFFGLLSLLALSYDRILVGGVLLGVAFLSKLAAIYFLPCVFLVVQASANDRLRWLKPFVVLLFAFAISAWWFARFDVMSGILLSFAVGGDKSFSGWTGPWTYWPARLTSDLGIPGLVIVCAGALILILHKVALGNASPSRGRLGIGWKLWPIAVLLPAGLYLALSRGKAPWMIVALYPALATIEALCIVALSTLIANCCRAVAPLSRTSFRLRTVVSVLAVLAMAVLADHDYASRQKDIGFGQWWGADASRQSAETINRLASPHHRLLITRFAYWGEDDTRMPCPVFAYYLKNIPVKLESFRIAPVELIATVRTNKIDWALLSPPPASGVTNLLNPLIRDYGLSPIVLKGSVLFRTTQLWQ